MSTINFDASSIKERIINRLRQQNLWQEILESSVSNALIEPFAEEIAYLASYDAYLTRENKWNLARNKTSLLAQQGAMRYDAYRKQGAEGTLKLSADETFNLEPSKNITIPKYSIFSTDSGVEFVSKDAYAITTSDKYIEIDIIQGTPLTYDYTGLGEDFEEIEIDSSTIDNSFYELSVNGTTWTKVDNIYEADYNDKVYELSNKIDFSGIYIKFGNNINGVKINSGDIIEFKYIETEGYDGNIATSNTVTTVDSTIFDVDGSVVDIYCTNSDALVGGTDVEDRESIRSNAPRYYSTSERCSNKDDYEVLIATDFNYVLKVVIWGDFEEYIDNGLNPWDSTTAVNENFVYCSVVRTDLSESLSDAQKLEISTAINEFKAPTDILKFEDSLIIPVIFTISAGVSDRSYSLSTVKTAIDTALENAYGIEQMSFFEKIYKSDYFSIIDGVSGVNNALVSVKFYQEFSLSLTWSFTDELVMYPITNNSISIYMVYDVDNSETLVATDVNGTLTAEAGYNISGSSVDMTSGDIAFIINSGPFPGTYSNYTVKIYYTTSEENLELKARNQIFDYNSTESLPLITVTYES